MATNPNMVAIETVTVPSGGAASIEFTSIPQTYTDLNLLLSLRGSISNVTGKITFNSNGSNYSYRFLSGNGSTTENGSGSATSSIQIYGLYNSSSYTATTFANASVYIPNYAGSNNKSVSIDTVSENNSTSAYASLGAGLWSNSAAITSIKIDLNSAGTFVEHSSATLYGVTSAQGSATGGFVTSDADYYYHTFTSSGTFTPLKALSCDVLVIAGGGGATNGSGEGSGGGGAGGVCYQAVRSVTASTAYTVTVGAGGTGASISSGAGAPTQGSNSVFDTITANGGGASRSEVLSPTSLRNGGSGGGGGGNATTAGTATQTNSGGATGYGTNGGAGYNSNPYAGGGGGGAGVAGSAASSTGGGAGGAGKNDWSSWATATGTGVSGYYAGGGAGGNLNGSGAAATGGSGGGGNGGKYAGGAVVTQPTAGTTNTGGGAGGGANQTEFKNGGSGIVIVRYAK